MDDQIAELRVLVERATSRERRMLTDPQRMIWRDDVEGICPSPEMCFDNCERVRCGPCAIKQAVQAGVESDLTVPNLPEVYRLRRRIDALTEALRPFAEVAEYIEQVSLGYPDDTRIMLTVADSCQKHHGLTDIGYSAFTKAALTLDGADGDLAR